MNVAVSVDIPVDVACSDFDAATVTVTSQGDGGKSDSSTLTTSADTVRGVTVEPPSDSQSGDPGEMVTYTLRVTNTGNCTDTFSLTVSGNAWNTDAPSSVGPLAPGATPDRRSRALKAPGAPPWRTTAPVAAEASPARAHGPKAHPLRGWGRTRRGIRREHRPTRTSTAAARLIRRGRARRGRAARCRRWGPRWCLPSRPTS